MEPSPLVVITQKRTSFLSGTSLNILQHLIYFGTPLKLEDIANHPQERDIENPAKCVVSALIYDPFNSIKSLRETKLIHHQALNLVKCLCEEVVKTDFPNAAKIFTDPLRNATCVGIHEIVEEILESFPSAIHLRSEKDQSLFHLAIVYRRENVFNLIYQMEEDRRARAFLSMPDASTNNALHSAGNLALQQQLFLRASAAGAALQMQCELQWFEIIRILKGEKDVEEFVKSQFGDRRGTENEETTDDEVYPHSSAESHLTLALLDTEDTSPSFSSGEQSSGTSSEEYLKGRWSRSSSLD
ncbi:hypothetical protein RHGRI_013416 [Rhododendron griersonianum]|uniref:Ankyrin repeat-containing protein n=1 Tax=Rhododendron griersonianum TaxID=479676 RepID=A0AAV6K5G9_9ERIC|nr:hypothetical protein RHGRI_013416 [Rhododendron griersonianum]